MIIIKYVIGIIYTVIVICGDDFSDENTFKNEK